MTKDDNWIPNNVGFVNRKQCSLSFPRRVFVPWWDDTYICDYIQPSETLEVCIFNIRHHDLSFGFVKSYHYRSFSVHWEEGYNLCELVLSCIFSSAFYHSCLWTCKKVTSHFERGIDFWQVMIFLSANYTFKFICDCSFLQQNLKTGYLEFFMLQQNVQNVNYFFGAITDKLFSTVLSLSSSCSSRMFKILIIWGR